MDKRYSAAQIRTELMGRYPILCQCAQELDAAYDMLLQCFRQGHRLFLAGNGGSAADCDHISGELMKSFRFRRGSDTDTVRRLQEQFGEKGEILGRQLERALPTFPLTAFSAVLTAFANDADADSSFAQLLYGYGAPGDIFLGITTSGNSENIYRAFMVAKARGIRSICLTGRNGGRCAGISDLAVRVPEDDTYLIQELHLPVYHALCAMLEADFFGNER